MTYSSYAPPTKESFSSRALSTQTTSGVTLMATSTNPQEANDLPSDRPLLDESRRTFINQCMSALAGMTVIGVVAPLLTGCEATTVAPGAGNSKVTINVSSLDVDGKALVAPQSGPDSFRILVVRQSATTYTALSMQCTHESNPVNPPVGGKITCPFHNSEFDLTGKVTKGPAGRSLHSYTTTFDDVSKILTIKLIA